MNAVAAAEPRASDSSEVLEFRAAVESDLQELQALYAQLIPDESPTIADMRGALVQINADPSGGIVVVGVKGGHIVSTCQIVFYPNLVRAPRFKAEIDSVVVDSGHRGQGIGRAMMRWAHEWLRQRQCSKIIVATAYTREVAHKMYETLGYVQSGYSYIYSYP
jgi:GNAT superfamily N-acetyltransferase